MDYINSAPLGSGEMNEKISTKVLMLASNDNISKKQYNIAEMQRVKANMYQRNYSELFLADMDYHICKAIISSYQHLKGVDEPSKRQQ